MPDEVVEEKTDSTAPEPAPEAVQGVGSKENGVSEEASPTEQQATSTPAVDNSQAVEVPPAADAQGFGEPREALESPGASDSQGGAKDDNSQFSISPPSPKASEGQSNFQPSPNEPVSNEKMGSIRTLTREMLKALSIKAHAVTEGRKRRKMERIMTLFTGGPTSHHKAPRDLITNDEVQIMLGVSDATAERYLGQLVKEGRLTKVSKGRFTEYRRK